MMTEEVKLYREYVRELRKFAPDWLEPEESPIWADIVKEYLRERTGGVWIPILSEGKSVGFLIIQNRYGDCHPSADFTIAQAFVRPEHRNRGLMTSAVCDFTRDNEGIYCFDVLKGNTEAEKFWIHLFEEVLCADRTYLPEVRGENERKYINIYGYKVRK